MMTLALSFELPEDDDVIPMMSSDNAELYGKIRRENDNRVFLDLLPRARYRLRCSFCQIPKMMLDFRTGIFVVADEDNHHIIVTNLSDKIVSIEKIPS